MPLRRQPLRQNLAASLLPRYRKQIIVTVQTGIVKGGPCPLWVKSGSYEASLPCPLYPRKRHQMRFFNCLLWAKSGHASPLRRAALNTRFVIRFLKNQTREAPLLGTPPLSRAGLMRVKSEAPFYFFSFLSISICLPLIVLTMVILSGVDWIPTITGRRSIPIVSL